MKLIKTLAWAVIVYAVSSLQSAPAAGDMLDVPPTTNDVVFTSTSVGGVNCTLVIPGVLDGNGNVFRALDGCGLSISTEVGHRLLRTPRLRGVQFVDLRSLDLGPSVDSELSVLVTPLDQNRARIELGVALPSIKSFLKIAGAHAVVEPTSLEGVNPLRIVNASDVDVTTFIYCPRGLYSDVTTALRRFSPHWDGDVPISMAQLKLVRER